MAAVDLSTPFQKKMVQVECDFCAPFLIRYQGAGDMPGTAAKNPDEIREDERPN